MCVCVRMYYVCVCVVYVYVCMYYVFTVYAAVCVAGWHTDTFKFRLGGAGLALTLIAIYLINTHLIKL